MRCCNQGRQPCLFCRSCQKILYWVYLILIKYYILGSCQPPACWERGSWSLLLRRGNTMASVGRYTSWVWTRTARYVRTSASAYRTFFSLLNMWQCLGKWDTQILRDHSPLVPSVTLRWKTRDKLELWVSRPTSPVWKACQHNIVCCISEGIQVYLFVLFVCYSGFCLCCGSGTSTNRREFTHRSHIFVVSEPQPSRCLPCRQQQRQQDPFNYTLYRY